ncbi:MAG TPA: type I methionyl aminopeptidase [Lentisphaeria bacterium]|nr:type I methionyl aminopeptidase [Lentisphaeria bacterium]
MPKPKYIIHSDEALAGIRQAAVVAATALDRICRYVRPGMTTGELDRYAGQTIKELGATSAFLNYKGFPGQVCISLNEEVVHGIGNDSRTVLMGDLVKIDCGVHFEGYVGDNARSVSMGPATTQVAKLMDITKASLYAGIKAANAGNTVQDIGRAIEKMVTSAGFSVVHDFVGHGCGVDLHEPPEVPNYVTRRATTRLRPGMVLAIEPMVNIGTHRVTLDHEDGWTVRTQDGSMSSHFEHMIIITHHEAEIITCPKTQ